MQGVGSDNKFYTTSSRFQSAQVGLGIPLFFGSQKARITAAKSNQQLADNNYIAGVQTIRTQYLSVLSQYKRQLQTVNYLKNNVINIVPIIIETANKQFSSGAINYLEWVQLTNQSVTIQNEYIETIKSLNESLIQLNYLMIK